MDSGMYTEREVQCLKEGMGAVRSVLSGTDTEANRRLLFFPFCRKLSILPPAADKALSVYVFHLSSPSTPPVSDMADPYILPGDAGLHQ